MTWQVLISRIRIPLVAASLVLLFLTNGLGVPGPLRLAFFVVVYIVAVRAGTLRRDPIVVRAPVSGRWRAVNSPGTKVPSHGVQIYGQSYAIDVVHEPHEGSRPRFGWRPLMRRATEFPAFGQPIVAAADGVVIRSHAWERDHWSRNSWPALFFVLVEGFVRELTGPSRVLGNHVIVDHGDGSYAVYAHLRNRSLQVTKGQRVRAGDHIADCGNSGNSTEPHLHFHVMDHPRPLFAAGLPISWERYDQYGASQGGMPATDQIFDAPRAEHLVRAEAAGSKTGHAAAP